MPNSDHIQKELTKTQQELNELKKEFNDLKALQSFIHNISEGISAKTGSHYFESLLIYLERELEASYTFVGKLNENNEPIMDTLRLCHNGEIIPNFSYELEHTPCENVMDKGICCYPNNVGELFPKDQLLIDMKIDAYAGVPLFNTQDQAIGILVALFEKPIANEKLVKSVLTLYASRAGVEIERQIQEEELRNQKNELAKALERAEESNLLKSAFLRNLSHEVRSPMNSIMGFIELLKSRKLTEDRSKQFMDLIGQKSQYLLNIIDKLVWISKIETEQVKLNLSNIELSSIESNIRSKLQFTFQHDIHPNFNLLVSENFKTKSRIKVDIELLRVILLNLIENSIKFSEKPDVFLEINELKDNVEFRVIDEGIGIPEESRELIFEPFRQVDESLTRSKGGIGTGLHICKKLVELMNGKLSFEENFPSGSIFKFRLPTLIKDAEQFKNTPDMKLDLSNKTILIVEDDSTSLMLLTEIISQTQANIITATNGQVAIDKIEEENNIDLVLLDIQVPVRSGLEVASFIRKNFPHINIVAQTAHALENDKTRCLDAGCHDYISKPFNEAEILQKIQQWI